MNTRAMGYAAMGYAAMGFGAMGFGAMVLMAGCSGAAENTPSGARATAEQAITIEPYREARHDARTIGGGAEFCGVFVYAYRADAPGCTISVDHCRPDPARPDDQHPCAGRIDERPIACGATLDVCGANVTCACPEEEPRLPPDPPNTLVVSPDAPAVDLATDAPSRCTARTLGATDFPDAPCRVMVHECDAASACIDREVDVSVGVLSDVCGRPFVCRR